LTLERPVAEHPDRLDMGGAPTQSTRQVIADLVDGVAGHLDLGHRNASSRS
jgi:hypothetical protein